MKNITYHQNKISSEDREKLLCQRGAVIWFTGLSGSGKSTIACEAERMLYSQGIKTFLLDGDNLRFGLNSDLGFSSADRDENLRRIAETAKLMAQAGLIVLVSAISPLSEQRQKARTIISPDFAFIEVFIDAPVEVCAKRDPKGLYKKAFSGEITDFTGVSAPYEAPVLPELHIKTNEVDISEAAEKVVSMLKFIQDPSYTIRRMCEIAVEAGNRIMKIYEGDFSVEYKEDNSPLTMADKTADAYINAELDRDFPDIARLSEETADDIRRRESRYCFIIDPLDGTREFVKRNGEFTVNIGLSCGGKAIAGVVYVPVTDVLYYALDGVGAYKTTGKGPLDLFAERDKLTVSKNTEKLTIMRSRSFADEKTLALLEKYKDKIVEIKVSGSSVKGCLIAEGEADAYYRFGPTCEWDTCAMQAIVEAAGGTLVQGDGSIMTYNRENTLNDKGFIILNRKENLWTI